MSSAATPRSPVDFEDHESGYSSASGSEELPEVYFTAPHLRHINAQLTKMEPMGMSSPSSKSLRTDVLDTNHDNHHLQTLFDGL